MARDPGAERSRIRASIWQAVSSVFLPPYSVPPVPSAFEGDPEKIRKERPLPSYTTTRYYLKDIEDAVHSADTGFLAQSARLSQSLRRDGVLGGILSTRTSGLARLPKQFRGTTSVIEALDNRNDTGLFDKIFAPKELALLAGDGIILGVGVGELVPLPDRPEPVFVRLNPEFLRYQWGDDAWYYDSTGGSLRITPGDGRWILHTPGGMQSPWANGLWTALSRAYVAKDHAFNHRENYSAKLANPARVAVSPAGATEPQRQGFLRRVMAWGVNTAFDLPPGWDIKLVESNGTGYQVFRETIESCDKEFMIALAGQVVTITGGAGFANADIHATIRSDLIQDDGDGLAQTLNTQAMPHITSRMFGAGSRASVRWDTKPPGNLNAEALAMTAAASAIGNLNRELESYGLRVDAREIVTRFQVPVLDTQPEAVERPMIPSGTAPRLALVPPPAPKAPDANGEERAA